jgi:hypothetical protein
MPLRLAKGDADEKTGARRGLSVRDERCMSAQ